MKVILLSSLVLLSVSWVLAEPPTSSYAHSSYDDPYADVGHSPHGHSHSHSSHGGSPYHQHHHHSPSPSPHEHHEHEVIIQQHHHPIEEAPVKIIQHGHPEAPAHYRPVSSGYKAAPSRTRTPHPNSYGDHSAYHSPSYASPSHSPYSKAPAYESPKDPYPEAPSLHAGYSSYKANDYKAYAAHTPSTHADDYGQGQENYGDYGHSYNSPAPPPSPYKGSSGGYSPPSQAYGSPVAHTQSAYSTPVAHSPGYSSYAAGYDHEPSHAPSYSSYRPKAKGYRASSYSTHSQSYGGSPHSHASSYGLPSKSSYSSYGVPKHSPKLSYPVSAPVKAAYPPKSSYGSYGLPKTYGAPVKSYYRTSQWKGYKTPSYSPAPSYGSPATKGFGYSYSPYEGAEKDSLRVQERGHRSRPSPYDEEDGPRPGHPHEDYDVENYNRGGYDSGSSHY